jgi:hypothetical protein
VEEAVGQICVGEVFRCSNGVYLGDVARGQLLDAVAISASTCFLLWTVLLCKWDGGRQLVCLVHLAQLCQDVDLLHGNGQQLGLLLCLGELGDGVAEVLGSLQTHLALRQLAAGYAPTRRIEGRLEDLEVLPGGLLLLRQLALACPLELRIDGARVDTDVVFLVLDGLACQLLVHLCGLGEVF